MKQNERHQEIRNILNTNGIVTVKECAQNFHVTEDCIRKDLKILETKQLLTRIHGGATPIKVNPHHYNVNDRKDINVENKKKIARKAIELIEPHSFIYLDVSTISIEIARELLLTNKDVTVSTNSIDVLNILLDSSIEVIFIGGNINKQRDGFDGTLTNDILKNLKFDIAFLGVVGLNLSDLAVSTYRIDDGLTKKQIMLSSKKNYMMLEKDKLEQEGSFIYASLDDFTGALIDKNLFRPQEKLFIEHHIEIY